ncbi:hypothetical protein BLNAU_24736 [Blattamonas nauphoetae]|uniref:Uncharacterized protein n=1 Tax=Blattamonas nauphoetae TaxID=2049346 RepID=A0ABQ9WM03_9EUKA|nr:hypothetical protein BLNAU_24736 [Blattamonas nauphoetae]
MDVKMYSEPVSYDRTRVFGGCRPKVKNVYGLMVDTVLPELGPYTKGQLQSTTNRPVYFLDILLVRERYTKALSMYLISMQGPDQVCRLLYEV